MPMFFPAFGFMFAGLFMLAYFGCWLWALIDCLNGNFAGNDKVVWLVVIIFVPFFGSMLYLAMGRSRKVPPGSGGLR